MVEEPLRVLVVEDHPLTRKGICDYLTGQGMLVCEASNTADALNCLREWRPQIAILDMVIPPHPGHSVNWREGDGLRAARLMKQAQRDIGIVFLSSFIFYGAEVLDLVKLGYGGVAFLFKGEGPAHELSEAIERVHKGQVWLTPYVSQELTARVSEVGHFLTTEEHDIILYSVSQMGQLTEREWEVVRQVAAAHSNAGIANQLHITPNAVTAHLQTIYDKVGLKQIDRSLDKRHILIKAYELYRYQI